MCGAYASSKEPAGLETVVCPLFAKLLVDRNLTVQEYFVRNVILLLQ